MLAPYGMLRRAYKEEKREYLEMNKITFGNHQKSVWGRIMTAMFPWLLLLPKLRHQPTSGPFRLTGRN